MAKILKKTGCGVVVVVILLVVVGVVGVQLFLKNHLTNVINDDVFGAAEEQLDIELDLDRASVNLLAGDINFEGLTVGNPEGFDEVFMFRLKRLKVDLGVRKMIRAILKGELDIEVTKVEVRDAALTIVKNKDEKINLKVLADTMESDEKTEQQGEPEDPAEESKTLASPTESRPPKFLLKDLHINTVVRYVDHTKGEDGKPMDLSIKTLITLQNLATFKAEGMEWAPLAIDGSLEKEDGKQYCKTDLDGKIAPITDPVKMSFDLHGEIGEIDLGFVMPYVIAFGVTGCESVSMRIDMVCRNGEFDRDKSVLSLDLNKVVLAKSMAKSLPAGMEYIPKLTLPFPLGGTLTEPDTPGFADVLEATVTANLGAYAKAHAGKAVSGAVGGLLGGGKDSKKADKKDDVTDRIKKRTPKLPF